MFYRIKSGRKHFYRLFFTGVVRPSPVTHREEPRSSILQDRFRTSCVTTWIFELTWHTNIWNILPVIQHILWFTRYPQAMLPSSSFLVRIVSHFLLFLALSLCRYTCIQTLRTSLPPMLEQMEHFSRLLHSASRVQQSMALSSYIDIYTLFICMYIYIYMHAIRAVRSHICGCLTNKKHFWPYIYIYIGLAQNNIHMALYTYRTCS